jgi:hypothetical protein
MFHLVCTVCLAVTASRAEATDYQDYKLNEVPAAYHSSRVDGLAEHGFGDYTFVTSYPDPLDLTSSERYLLFGATTSDGYSVGPWWIEIMKFVDTAQQLDGKIPQTIDPILLRRVFGELTSGDVPKETIDAFKSPINGDLPRLDAREFSSGDLFIKKLTSVDMLHFAERNSVFQDDWFVDYPTTPESVAVYYYRIYGCKEVILDGLWYTLPLDL